MHGLVNRALQRFVSDTYGQNLWRRIAAEARLGFETFEAMLHYDDALTEAVLDASVARLGKPREELLEDLGIYLVAHPNSAVLRRLLRFAGQGFEEFLLSLDDLPERVRLAVPDLDFPAIATAPRGTDSRLVTVRSRHAGTGRVIAGALRAMADDYGVLATITFEGADGDAERLLVQVHDAAFAEGRDFHLARSGAA